jgi:hypothetical protein
VLLSYSATHALGKAGRNLSYFKEACNLSIRLVMRVLFDMAEAGAEPPRFLCCKHRYAGHFVCLGCSDSYQP